MENKSFNIYRLEHKITHKGPWEHENIDRDFKESWYEETVLYYEDGNHPPWSSDFNIEFLQYNIDNGIIMKIGVANPCQILWWFGPYIDLLFNEFNIYQVKVKKFKEGSSKKQVLFFDDDIISETLIEELKPIF